jgi:hypothetical protein
MAIISRYKILLNTSKSMNLCLENFEIVIPNKASNLRLNRSNLQSFYWLLIIFYSYNLFSISAHFMNCIGKQRVTNR